MKRHRMAVILWCTATVALGLFSKLTSAAIVPSVIMDDPEFTEPIVNVTVPAGRSVKLGCSVRNLGSYKVAWMHFEQSAILTVNSHVITRNPRITVSHDKHRTWFLHIGNVQQEDRGRYMCQINTITAKTQIGFLNVVVPPSISDSLSSSDAIVREGANVSLTCHVDGFPKPEIKWKRDDGAQININKTLTVSEWAEPTLELHKISRLDMGAYLCIATNSVPPSVSKRIKVSVDFPPMLWIPHQLVGVPLGYNVTLECYTEAHPTSLHYWTRDNGQMLHDNSKYKAISIQGIPSYKVQMKLTIMDVSQTDYGVYKCVAKNSRGETDGTIRLYTSHPPTLAPELQRTENPYPSGFPALGPQWPTGNNDLENSASNHMNGNEDNSFLNEIDHFGEKNTIFKPENSNTHMVSTKNSTPRLKISTEIMLLVTAATVTHLMMFRLSRPI
ncbi:lachesin-like isoform X2 [Daktulosphaira vitifoliae]|uniref:lachesin-like isoform X2 n=1 Tax=Daktulosphaira vitifoliae TaxID=58002 RepID=UPI0021AAAA79|nr:lachesin-like isoform X2 [Daktulosphaira vitifoliae]